MELSDAPLVVTIGDRFENPYSTFAHSASEEFDIALLLSEKTFYKSASLAPSWILSSPRSDGAKMNREAVFPNTMGTRSFFEFANFEPELFTVVNESERPAPAFNGEIKSAGTGRVMWDEIANHVLFSVIDSFFRENQDSSYRIFYENVPIGFGLMGMAGVGYFVCMEVVGKAFITPCTKPFFIGSKDHEQAIEGLPREKYKNSYSLNCDQEIFRQCDKLRDKSVVTGRKANDGKFWKIIRFDAFSPSYFRRMHKVYSQYQKLKTDDLQNHSLLPAQLLYGEFEVAVRTDFLEGYRSGEIVDMEDSVIMRMVAKAVVFLARSGLLYTDLRPPNFMVGNENHVVLIDYDDIEIIGRPISSLDEFHQIPEFGNLPPQNNYMNEENAFFQLFRECLGEAWRENES